MCHSNRLLTNWSLVIPDLCRRLQLVVDLMWTFDSLWTGRTVEVCMGVGNPMEFPFPWESHGNGNSHTAHDGNGNGNKANGNGNSIYFTRVKIPKINVMH